MELFNLFQIVGALLLLIAGLIFMIAGRERGLFLAIIFFGGGCLSFLTGTLLETQNNPSKRYISKDEARAAKMFKQNCKQVSFIQANNTSGIGVGMTGQGSPVLGTVSSSNEDSFVYVCDGNVQYTLTYDIEKYRKFYQ
ncbi:hypothetical protein N5J44_16315 [Acinetobacter ursingii]|uniref:hypothetical protein n=1 Tax=Acinetobacter TaxID=469 RepID=UPI00244A6B2B|nr:MULTISPECIES: hypothetical protein [Acinetobacter]MDH2020741.1 hypothetical protein [Acinetobacter ursingii]MDH2073070.1 hypothetical protein [Acinetobacter ursingii]MDV2439999.1 hypothetical protein [Acinetobacter gerneri]